MRGALLYVVMRGMVWSCADQCFGTVMCGVVIMRGAVLRRRHGLGLCVVLMSWFVFDPRGILV